MTDARAAQLEALNTLLSKLAANPFYAPLLRDAGLTSPVASLDDFASRMPLTTKQQLVDDQLAHPPFGTNRTHALERYTRFCQTSGTAGSPMIWLDTNDSWQVMLDCWKRVYGAAGCDERDRVFFAFSFGPFLGFWTAFEAATQLGYLCIPGGGMSSAARLRIMRQAGATTLCCTPTYALRLAEVARQEGIDLSQSSVRRIIVAGEPGGSIPATRRRIEAGWPTARVFDHHGMTEVGPVTHELSDRPGVLRIMTDAYLAEVIDPRKLTPVRPGEQGELVLTTLKRDACPLLRYRTGDLVQQDASDPALLVGGILGRTDDMVLVRGVNVYPAAVERIVRAYDDVAEYRATLRRTGDLAELALEVEPTGACGDGDGLCDRIAGELRDAFALRVPVALAPADGLPRFEMKAKRWIIIDA